MKNFDLIWARERAGLTQQQAAELFGVDRKTIGRWETGAVKMPNRKWHAFLKLIEVAETQIPKRLIYDDKGYPTAFDRAEFDFNLPKYFLRNDEEGDPIHDDARAWDDEDAALEAMEGAEYPCRQRERYRIALSTPGADPAYVAKSLAEFDARELEFQARSKIK